MPTIKQALQQAQQQLPESDSASLDAEVLLAFILDTPRSHLHAWPEQELSDNNYRQYQHLIGQRRLGHPVAHLTGQRDFWSLSLRINPDTLIPRPETELLVEQALAVPLPHDARVLDVGTGSGAIALALASERPHWQVYGCDISAAALEIARHNAECLRLPVKFQQSDLFNAYDQQRFDLIISNPPYVADNDPHLERGDVRFEPAAALKAGDDGLEVIRAIVGSATPYLRGSGYLLIEHGYDQCDALAQLLNEHGFQDVRCVTDLSGLPRVSLGRLA